MIEEAEFNAELQDAISRAYSGLNDRDRALVDSQAALAYDRKAKELFGEFACLNFPEETNDVKQTMG